MARTVGLFRSTCLQVCLLFFLFVCPSLVLYVVLSAGISVVWLLLFLLFTPGGN